MFWLSRLRKAGVSSKRNFDSSAREERGVRCEGLVVRHTEGVRNEACLEALGGETLNRFVAGVFSWSFLVAFCTESRRRFDGVFRLLE